MRLSGLRAAKETSGIVGQFIESRTREPQSWKRSRENSCEKWGVRLWGAERTYQDGDVGSSCIATLSRGHNFSMRCDRRAQAELH
jgi:hypothetical protein